MVSEMMMPHSRVAVRMKISFSDSATRSERWIGRTVTKYVSMARATPITRPPSAAAYAPTFNRLAIAQDDTAAATMMAPCERFSTPDTPKISVNPVAPSAYRELMAKPSIRICQKSMPAASRLRGGGQASGSTRGGQLDEGGELHGAGGEALRPDVHLLAILPLQHQAGDVARAGAQAVHVRIALGLERDAADGADVVGLFHRRDQLVAVGGARALDGLGDHVDLVIGRVARVGRVVAVLLDEGIDEGQRPGRDGDTRARDGLVQHALGRAIGVLPEGGVGRLRGDAEHGDRHLLALPLHRGLRAHVRDARDHHVGLVAFDLAEDRREVGGVRREADVVQDLQAGLG